MFDDDNDEAQTYDDDQRFYKETVYNEVYYSERDQEMSREAELELEVDRQFKEEMRQEAEQEEQEEQERRAAAQEWEEFAREHPEEAAAMMRENESKAGTSHEPKPEPQPERSSPVPDLDDLGEIPF